MRKSSSKVAPADTAFAGTDNSVALKLVAITVSTVSILVVIVLWIAGVFY